MSEKTDSANVNVAPCIHQTIECAGDVWCVLCHEFQPWATRIEAAIKRAEEGPQDDSYECGDAAHDAGCRCDVREGWPSATEAALAKALWSLVESGDCGYFSPPEPLIAFTEKVESLD